MDALEDAGVLVGHNPTEAGDLMAGGRRRSRPARDRIGSRRLGRRLPRRARWRLRGRLPRRRFAGGDQRRARRWRFGGWRPRPRSAVVARAVATARSALAAGVVPTTLRRRVRARQLPARAEFPGGAVAGRPGWARRGGAAGPPRPSRSRRAPRPLRSRSARAARGGCCRSRTTP